MKIICPYFGHAGLFVGNWAAERNVNVINYLGGILKAGQLDVVLSLAILNDSVFEFGKFEWFWLDFAGYILLTLKMARRLLIFKTFGEHEWEIIRCLVD